MSSIDDQKEAWGEDTSDQLTHLTHVDLLNLIF